MKFKAETRFVIILFIGIVETILMGIFLARISSDSKNALMWGFSAFRLINLVIFASIVVLLSLLICWKRQRTKLSKWIEGYIAENDGWLKAGWLFFFLFVLFFILLQVPGYRLGAYQFLWERLYPNILLVELFILNGLIYIVWDGVQNNNFSGIEKSSSLKQLRKFAPFAGIILLLVLFVSITKIGIVEDVYHWNTAGVPVLASQILVLFLGYLILIGIRQFGVKKPVAFRVGIIAILLWLAAAVTWIAQPIARNYFVYLPEETVRQQYYPKSDAQRFDQGAELMLLGEGIYGGISDEKPFLMALIAGVKLVGGSNYQNVVNVQVLLLALVIPGLFLIGREIHSTRFGIALAVLGILYEVTTFNSSGYINNVHVKLIMSEPYTLLGMVWVAYTLILWMKNPDKTYLGFITFAFVGFFSFVRTNMLGIFFIVFSVGVLFLRAGFSRNLKRTLVASLAIMSVNIPWTIYAYWKYGYLVVLNKLDFVLRTRYQEVYFFSTPTVKLAKTVLMEKPAYLAGAGEFFGYLYVVISHFFNNLIKSVLIFPTRLKFDEINIVLDQPYWNENMIWNGKVGLVFFLNLLIITVGITYLYKKHRWISLAPLAVSLGYYLSLAFARTSGGRYMDPGIWAFYLYYLAGLFSAFEWVCSQFGWELELFAEKQPHRMARISNKLPLTIIIITLIGHSIPLADAVIPAKYKHYTQDEMVTILMSKPEFSETYQNDSRFASFVDSERSEVFHGEIHYPIRQPEEGVEDQLEYQFAILGPEISREAHFGTEEIISEIREGREVIALGCEAGFPDQILFLYIVEEDAIFQTERNFDEICPST